MTVAADQIISMTYRPIANASFDILITRINLDKMIRLLGQGTFGKVVECFDRDTGKHCAIKIIRAVQKYRDASKIEARVLNTLKKSDPRNS